MAYLIEHKTQVIYVTASSVNQNGKKLKIVVESRPEFAIVRLAGARGEFPITWKMIFEAAMRHHAENLRLETDAERSRKPRKRKRTG
jgi:hypothetical protein